MLWIHKKGYLQGVFWAILVCFISALNDVFTRLAGWDLPSLEVSFFRALFSGITLLPVMFIAGKDSFKTKQLPLHFFRSVLLFGALSCWCIGVVKNPLSMASILAQTTPLFVLIFAYIFLKEKIGYYRLLATFFGFVGIVITMQTSMSFEGIKIEAVWFIVAAILFALSDIVNKTMIKQEPMLPMMFYLSLGTTLIAFIPATSVWVNPTFGQLFWLFCLGLGANSILYCLLKAFAAAEISALMPFRYVEIFFAVGFGYTLFSEVPTIFTLIGGLIIIPSTLIVAIYEVRSGQKSEALAA